MRRNSGVINSTHKAPSLEENRDKGTGVRIRGAGLPFFVWFIHKILFFSLRMPHLRAPPRG